MRVLSLKMLRNSGKKKLFIIPFIFTFANAFLGFMSVIKTFEGEFITAAYCIMFAVIMDFLDGRLARAFNSSSSIGMELDSLCDAISFCFAPAILLYSWYLNDLGLMGLFVLTLFLCSGLFRLAKYNTLTVKKGVSSFFTGMPTPVGAIFIALLVVHHEWILGTVLRYLLHPVGVLIVVATLAMLMISSVRFPSFKLYKPSLRLVIPVLLGVGIFALISFVRGIPFLFLGIMAYIIGGLFFSLYSFLHSIFLQKH